MYYHLTAYIVFVGAIFIYILAGCTRKWVLDLAVTGIMNFNK